MLEWSKEEAKEVRSFEWSGVKLEELVGRDKKVNKEQECRQT